MAVEVDRMEAEPEPGRLRLSDLTAIGIGQAVGSGLITLIGPAILLTGQSAWFTYVLAVFWGFAMICPIPFITSALRIQGGFYSIVAGMGGKKLAGMYALAFLPQVINGSVYGVAMGMYAHSLWPQLNSVAFGSVFVTIFFIINLFGINVMAKTQKALVVILFCALAMFGIGGAFKISNPVFNFSTPAFFSGGAKGVFMAIMLFVYSTNGYSCIMNYGRNARDARRDVPRAIFLCVPILVLVYGGIAIVATGVLPLEQVAGQPLTYVAQRVLTPSLFVLFMIGGPLLELSTSVNSTLANNWVPIAQSCRDGWLPKSLASENRFGVPWKILTFAYVVAIVPVLLDFSIQRVVASLMLVVSGATFLQIFAYYRLPKIYPHSWEEAHLHVPNWCYYLIVTTSLVAYVAVFLNSVITLPVPMVLIGVTALIICMVYGLVRSRSEDVIIRAALWGDIRDVEAIHEATLSNEGMNR